MSKLIVNLTEKVAEQEIDKQLQDVPEPVLQRINTPFDLHQSLVMYVLKRLPNQYMVVEDQNLPDSEYEEFEATAEDRSQIAHLISQGLHCLLSESDSSSDAEASEATTVCSTAGYSPSDWFG
jgi:hypothetical protein